MYVALENIGYVLFVTLGYSVNYFPWILMLSSPVSFASVFWLISARCATAVAGNFGAKGKLVGVLDLKISCTVSQGYTLRVRFSSTYTKISLPCNIEKKAHETQNVSCAFCNLLLYLILLLNALYNLIPSTHGSIL